MALPKPRPNDRFDADDRARDRERRLRLLAEFDALRESIRERNPAMTEDDWSALADEWSEAVDEGLRRRVRQLRGEIADDDSR